MREHLFEGAPGERALTFSGRSERDCWAFSESKSDRGYYLVSTHRAGGAWGKPTYAGGVPEQVVGFGPWESGSAVVLREDESGRAALALLGSGDARGLAIAPPQGHVEAFQSFASGAALAIAIQRGGGAILWTLARPDGVPTMLRIPMMDVCGEEIAEVDAWSAPRIDRMSAIVRSRSSHEYVIDWDGSQWRFTPAPFGRSGPFPDGSEGMLDFDSHQKIARAADDALWLVAESLVWRRRPGGLWERMLLPPEYDGSKRGPRYSTWTTLLLARSYDEAWLGGAGGSWDAPDESAWLYRSTPPARARPLSLHMDDSERIRIWKSYQEGP